MDRTIIGKICERADQMRIIDGERMVLMMDLESAAKYYFLDLRRLLEADDEDFVHDIRGIQRNINRKTKEIENYFVPRCAR